MKTTANTKPLSLRQLGAGLGLSHVACHRLVAKGMPRDIEAAREWRMHNVRLTARRTRGNGRDTATSFGDWLDRGAKVETMQDAVNFFCFYLAGYEQRLDAMPDELAHGLRPDAPEVAHALLAEWRENLKADMAARLTALAAETGN